MKKPPAALRTVRRSVALPGQLVQRARAAAPAELRDNVNRIVVVALQEYVARRQQEQFCEQMADMALDTAIQAECESIARAFRSAEADGLPGAPAGKAGRRGQRR